MPIPKSSWKGYAAGAIVIWAVGLQVSMWSLQKKPEFKQKFPELIDETQQPVSHVA
ncbi:hypothetical protein ABBQ32_009568 [Trebouxia sp. C0010 RCD-2024]